MNDVLLCATKKRGWLLTAALLTALNGCAWVKLEDKAAAVRVAPAGEDLTGCSRVAEITVEVRDKVSFYRRDPVKVRDELETLARNEAYSLPADTIQPLDEPRNGEQRFGAYQCGNNRAADRHSPASPPSSRQDSRDSAETFPARDD